MNGEPYSAVMLPGIVETGSQEWGQSSGVPLLLKTPLQDEKLVKSIELPPGGIVPWNGAQKDSKWETLGYGVLWFCAWLTLALCFG